MKKDLNFLEKKLLDLKNNISPNLHEFIINKSKIVDEYEENILKHYIKFQTDTSNKNYEKNLNFSQGVLKPILTKYKEEANKLILKLISENANCEYKSIKEGIQNNIDLYCEKNTALEIEEDKLINKYLKITGNLTVKSNKNLSINDLYGDLYDKNESIRKIAYLEIAQAYLEIQDKLKAIYEQLIRIRTEQAKNLNIEDFVKYSFKKLERHDYTALDCKNLAETIRYYFLPLKLAFQSKQLAQLNKEKLKPWDARISPYSDIKNVFFNSEEMLLKIAGNILVKVDPYFGCVFEEIKRNSGFDLEVRPNKASGGFSEFLPFSKQSFIFMNLLGTHDDLVTLIHEMGHAIHHDLIKDIQINEYKKLPMEIAEFAAMSLELLTMDYWDIGFEDTISLNKAKLEQFRAIIEFLPLTIIVDQFQHWIYNKPNHTQEERNHYFKSLVTYYDNDYTDWSDCKDWKGAQWLSIIHIFESPFYYIEYAIAQIAALQLYKNYRESPQKTIEKFKHALSQGSKISVREAYNLAGVSFDFSEKTILSIIQFIEEEVEFLEGEITKATTS